MTKAKSNEIQAVIFVLVLVALIGVGIKAVIPKEQIAKWNAEAAAQAKHETDIRTEEEKQSTATKTAYLKWRRELDAENARQIANMGREKDVHKHNAVKRQRNTPKPQVAHPSEVVPATPREDLEVLNVKGINEDYVSYASGTIRNNTDRTYDYVQVEINIYDLHGNQTGSTMANCNNLEPHRKWKFKAVVLERGRYTFEVKNVTGF